MISIRKKNDAVPGQRSGWLQISSKVDCGLQLLVELARNAVIEHLSLRKIAEKHSISFYFLQKVAADLRKSGLIISGRGKNGGYSLSKSAKDITILDIVESHEGPVSLMHCLSDKECFRADQCNIRPGLDLINNTIVETLSKTTLLDFIKLSSK